MIKKDAKKTDGTIGDINHTITTRQYMFLSFFENKEICIILVVRNAEWNLSPVSSTYAQRILYHI